MDIEELDRFDNFAVWDVEYSKAYLVADDKETCRPVRLSLDSSESKLIVSFSVPIETPESNWFVSKEKAFEMLSNNEFSSK